MSNSQVARDSKKKRDFIDIHDVDAERHCVVFVKDRRGNRIDAAGNMGSGVSLCFTFERSEVRAKYVVGGLNVSGLNGTVSNEIPGHEMLKAARGGTHNDVLDTLCSFSLMYTAT